MTAGFDWRRLRDPNAEGKDNKRWRVELAAMCMDDPEVREAGRRVCQNNLLALTWVLGYCLVDEEIHREAIDFFLKKDMSIPLEEQAIGHKRRGSLLLPRGVYKTTLSLANCVQLITCWPLTIAIMILCGNRDLAWAFVDQVGSFFVKRKNAAPTLFQVLFSELCIERQESAGEFTAAIRQREPEIIEPAIWGASIESGTSGWHPNYLVVDDVTNNRNARTFESRVSITKKYKLVRKVLIPTGIERRVGTLYGSGDIFSEEVLTSRPETYSRVLKPALRLKNGERLDPNGFPEEDEVELMFPAILSYEYLREEYEGGYDSFMTQFMLDEFGAAEVVFSQDEMVSAMLTEREMPLEGEPIIHWRLPCRSKRWETAVCAIGTIQRNRCYILEVMQGHYKPSVLAKLVVSTARRYHIHDISIEDSPGASMMQPAIMNAALTVGWDIRIHWKNFEEDTGDRDTRIRNIETLLPDTRLLFNSDMKQFKTLMLEFTRYGMIPEQGIPDCVARVADHLPQSIAAENEEEEDAWAAMMERDKMNLIYGRGKYARPEPEPEEMAMEEETFENQKYNSQGLEIMMPGLE